MVNEKEKRSCKKLKHSWTTHVISKLATIRDHNTLNTCFMSSFLSKKERGNGCKYVGDGWGKDSVEEEKEHKESGFCCGWDEDRVSIKKRRIWVTILPTSSFLPNILPTILVSVINSCSSFSLISFINILVNSTFSWYYQLCFIGTQ